MKADQDKATLWRIPMWFWLVLPALLLLVQALLGPQSSEPLPYSDFKQLLRAGKVNDLLLNNETIKGTLNTDGLEQILPKQRAAAISGGSTARRDFVTVRVGDPALTDELEAAGVHYAGQVRSEWLGALLSWLLPLALILWLSSYLTRRAGFGAGWALDIGKSRARAYVESQTGVSFDDVAGIDEAKEELREIVDFLKNPQRYRRLGGKIPKGVLIVGAPGTGKTLLARAVAGEAGVPFFSISGSEFVEMFVGVGAARVRDLFAQAEQKAPCIVFIDELDALGKARGMGTLLGGHSEQEQTLNQLLVEMDGFDANKGVIILAATNRPEILDPALLRPGRFDRHVGVDRPDLRGREKILQVHARQVKLAPQVELGAVAARTAGFAGADLANLVNEATLLAARRGKDQVGMAEFDEAIDRVVAGLEKRTRVMNPQEKETVAFHEAGHALIAEFRRHADRVAKISIIPRGVAALGYTQQLPTEDRYLLKRSELYDRLDVLLGGRVAEELVFGDISTGAQNDLQTATDMARHMVTQYGMSERLGLATFEEVRGPLLNPAAPAEKKSYSEHTAETIDAEISKLLDEAHARVLATLRERRGLLDKLARLLLENETVDRAALDALGKEAAPPACAIG
ncbi:ATP-dependent zinc metalloprotease FtsH [Janthinobacterium fluminis]|uniref:ATP-dependent zinc metalloprotease FtsH n=1 Tax=Janthinobacterium fluminis TaxID=2987524 RepID=A0ABT5K2X4_9BURK|nr:ATP-dependent zinc metalloprotease FtsH [Janthinobacterium fluminis]MDC8758800.1 ATP-dependent zinc metalloprotease FtsH [Janthinobacterium fluminis]